MTTVDVDGHPETEILTFTTPVVPTEPVTITGKETITTVIDGRNLAETVTTTYTYEPTVEATTEVENISYTTFKDGRSEVVTTPETVTVEKFTTTEDVDGRPKTFTLTSTLTTIDTTPVKISEVEIYTSVITYHGRLETVTKKTTVSYYEMASSAPETITEVFITPYGRTEVQKYTLIPNQDATDPYLHEVTIPAGEIGNTSGSDVSQ